MLPKYYISYIHPMGICIFSWCGLGFLRGVQSYIYIYNKTHPYLYANIISNGLFGSLVYINPVLLPFIFYKELYRLEVNIRNLKHEKKSDLYNKLLV